MAIRMAGYIIRLIETYQIPVYSNVIYLRPDAGRRDLGYYEQGISETITNTLVNAPMSAPQHQYFPQSPVSRYSPHPFSSFYYLTIL